MSWLTSGSGTTLTAGSGTLTPTGTAPNFLSAQDQQQLAQLAQYQTQQQYAKAAYPTPLTVESILTRLNEAEKVVEARFAAIRRAREILYDNDLKEGFEELLQLANSGSF